MFNSDLSEHLKNPLPQSRHTLQIFAIKKNKLVRSFLVLKHSFMYIWRQQTGSAQQFAMHVWAGQSCGSSFGNPGRSESPSLAAVRVTGTGLSSDARP